MNTSHTPAKAGGASAPTLGPSIGGAWGTLASPGRMPLARWFGLVSLLVIAAIASASVALLGWFVTQRMLAQEGHLTSEFVHSLMLVEPPLQAYFRSPGEVPPAPVLASFEHIARMPDVLRANVYDRSRRVMWSSDPALIGRRFGPNDELDEALAGGVVVERKAGDGQARAKAEHERMPKSLFVEIYVPVQDVASGQTVGAIEFYKNPLALTRTLADLKFGITLGALGCAALLFAALFGLVLRADRVMRAQQHALVQNETFAALGELSSVVAHGIRNPLAAIRSSAELALQSPDAAAAEGAHDIVAQSDRLGAWLRELLAYTRAAEPGAQPVALAPLVRSLMQELARDFDRRHVGATAELPDTLPAVRGDALGLGQVLRSVLANALEALPEGGRIQVQGQADAAQRRVTLTVADNGTGMTAQQRAQAGRPLYTTKPQGMGVGLALARRVIERAGGRLAIASEPGRGTVVTIELRAA